MFADIYRRDRSKVPVQVPVQDRWNILLYYLDQKNVLLFYKWTHDIKNNLITAIIEYDEIYFDE